ncbi:MAG: (2Fe-2S)-binding protein [Spirochaetales bacterium]|nr:(2Fe-2S)-binding protein [Spirochaetales bacterium]
MLDVSGNTDALNIFLKINNENYNLTIKKNWTLVHVLREVLDLTGTKACCKTGDCGSCMVLIDGEAVESCIYLAKNADGKQITTIEGLADGTALHPIQEAFIEAGAVQCGFCTPGMIMSTKSLLDKNPDPSKTEITKALERNLCRCTGYIKIIDAVNLASQKMKG